MALEKVQHTAKTAAKIKEAGKGKVGDRKFEDSNIYSMPKKGKFVSWALHKNTIAGNTVHYYVMNIEDKAGKKFEYSVSGIQKMLNTDIDKASDGVLSKIGGESNYSEYYKLDGSKPINPDFMGNQAKIIEQLLKAGDFEAEEISGFTARFTDDDDKKEVLKKTGYLLTLD